MSDNLQKRHPQDSSKISLTEAWELKYWTDKFNCTEAELRNAVKQVGNGAEKVRQHLAGK